MVGVRAGVQRIEGFKHFLELRLMRFRLTTTLLVRLSLRSDHWKSWMVLSACLSASDPSVTLGTFK